MLDYRVEKNEKGENRRGQREEYDGRFWDGWIDGCMEAGGFRLCMNAQMRVQQLA